MEHALDDAARFDRDDHAVDTLLITSSTQCRLCVVNACAQLLLAAARTHHVFVCCRAPAGSTAADAAPSSLFELLSASWTSAQHHVTSTFASSVHLFVLPDITQQQWSHFQPFFKCTKPSYGVTMWNINMRGLVFDLQLCCSLPRFKAPILITSFFDALPTIEHSSPDRNPGFTRSAASSGPNLADFIERSIATSAQVMLSSCLSTSLLPIIDVYCALHPSRVRMEQYRTDVGYLISFALSLMPNCMIGASLVNIGDSMQLVLQALNRLLCIASLMAGPPSYATAAADVIEAMPVDALPDASHSWPRLPPALHAFAAAFRLVCTSPIQHARAEVQFNPVDWRGLSHAFDSDVINHDVLRSWSVFSYPPSALLTSGASRQELVTALCRRHELCTWEYPPLSAVDIACKEALLSRECIRQHLAASTV